MPLIEGKSHFLTSAPEGMTVVGENGELSFVAVHQTRDLGIVMTAGCKWAEQCELLPGKQRENSSVSYGSPEVFISLRKVLIGPHLGYCVQAWTPSLKLDVACLESVQRLTTRMVEGQRGKCYIRRLKGLNMS